MFRSMTIIRSSYLNLAKVTLVWCGSMLPHHCIVYKDVFFTELLTIVTLARFKYELPDDGHRPKHVGVI